MPKLNAPFKQTYTRLVLAEPYRAKHQVLAVGRAPLGKHRHPEPVVEPHGLVQSEAF